MFLDFYGLREQPFGVTPDPRYIFWSSSHSLALESIYRCIESDSGFVTLIAPAGMGKTTLLFHLLEQLRSTSRALFLFQTQCSSLELLRYLIKDLGSEADEQDEVRLQGKLNEILTEESRAGKRVFLILDEAQNLDLPVLESIRLLSDLGTPSRKLMQIVMAGQPQLASKLASEDLVQLRRRISIVSTLRPLITPEVQGYIEHRLHVAGYPGASPFTSEAVALISWASEGIPRTLNNICFNALTVGYAQGCKRIKASIINEVLSDLRIIGPWQTGVPKPVIEPSRSDDLSPLAGLPAADIPRLATESLTAAVTRTVTAASRARAEKPAAEHSEGNGSSPMFESLAGRCWRAADSDTGLALSSAGSHRPASFCWLALICAPPGSVSALQPGRKRPDRSQEPSTTAGKWPTR